MILVIQTLLSNLIQLFTAPMFYLGGTAVSVLLLLKLGAALLIVLLVIRLLKSFLKTHLLSRFKIDASNQEAIATMISYFLGAISFLVIIQSTGFNLASVGLILGGLGVGIGFGLQNTTNDFISGLTLLFERTLKVGDFIEFDGLAGYIKEVKLRSTIIRTLDDGDVVVPNSHLIENRILNWSYDNFTARLRIPVAVAYGSDPVLVTETLLKSAYMEPNVLREPLPRINFIDFGDSALRFEVRVWVSQIDRRDDIISSLNFVIEYNLRQQGIRIPFPQRDVWLRDTSSFPYVPNGSTRYGPAWTPPITEPINVDSDRLNTVRLNNGQAAPNGRRFDSTDQTNTDQTNTDHQLNQDPNRQINELGVTQNRNFLRDGKAERIFSQSTDRANTLSVLLRQVRYFENLSEIDIRQLIEIGYRTQFAPSELIFREGDPGDAFYVILSGQVEVLAERLQKRLTILEAGQFFGEVSLLLGIPRTATVRTTANTLLFVINSRSFSKLLQDYPNLAESIIQEFGQHRDELHQRQQELRRLGLLDQQEDERNPVDWARKRIQQLFNLKTV
ncbi:MAG: mechanosensitive ion channel domain-containing protein [Thainema sp.]